MPIRLNSGIDLNQIKHTWQGDWNPGQIYYLNDVVRYHGQSFVCVTTVLADERRYGTIYKPTVANAYWQPFSNGYLIKGNWAYKEYYYPGDVVKYNDDWYLCNTYTFGGHPIYENGGLSTKWTLLTTSSRTNKSNNHLWFAGYNPMGWTYNQHEITDQFVSQDIQAFTTINGNYEASYLGRGTSTYGFGSETFPNAWRQQTNAGYDFWDYYDGYRTSITGGMPKCIQVVGGWQHKLFLFDNGEVYSMGYGGRSQNGDGTTNNYHYTRRVGRSTGGRGTGLLRDVFVVKVAASGGNAAGAISNADYEHCAALDSNGQVWMWGYNGYGGLGNGTNTNLSSPTQIDQKFFDNAKIVDIWCTGTGSYQSTFALDQNGQLWGWGYDGYGCLGTGDWFVNNGGVLDYQARPKKVLLDFAKYGGIKKFIPGGWSSNKGSMVQTNDDQLWFWGYSSYAAGWGYGANETVIHRPRRLKELIYESASSLGIDKTPMVGNAVDVVTNCEEFWWDARNGNEAVYLKEKSTGLMYGMGRNYNYSMPFNRASSIYPGEGNQNIPFYDSGAANAPILMQIGDFKDVKSVHTHGHATDIRGNLFLNRDGRMFVTGQNSTDQAMGVGVNFTTEHISQQLTLPWEYDANAALDATQVRWSDSIDMIIGYSEFGWGAITKNNRFVFCGSGGGTYNFSPSDVTTNSYTPTRLVM